MEEIKKILASKLQSFDSSSVKAVAIDIDGTLINSEGQCSLRTEEAVKGLVDKGIDVFIATGRGVRTALPYAVQCGIKSYMINYNGAVIWNFDTHQREYENYINSAYVLPLLESIRKHNILGIVYVDDEFYYEVENKFLENYLSRITISGYKKPLDELSLESFQKIIVMADKNIIHKLYDELQGIYKDKLTLIITTPSLHNMLYSMPESLAIEIMNKDANKGYALRELLNKKGISPKETVAFGDDNNDIEMLATVQWGIAMANAKPLVKKTAPLETLSNNHDGVAYFIENYLL